MDQIILLNQDTHVHKDWITELCNSASDRGEVGIFSSLEMTYDGKGLDPANRRGLIVNVGEFVNDLVLGQVRNSYRVYECYAGAMMVHRKVFEAIGFFDTVFFIYGEDIDFCRRATRCGIPIWFIPKSIVYHYSTFSSENGWENPKTAHFARRSWIILDIKNPERPLWRSIAAQLKTRLHMAINNLIRMRFASVRHCMEDTIWILANISRLTASRRFDIKKERQATSINKTK